LGWKDGENKYRVRVSVGHKEREFAQSHAFTHIFYIVEGSATFVTGGTIVDPKTVKQFSPEPGTGQEIRGTAIEGGETHHVSKGDVLITPRGVPHWWKEIQPGPFVYFVVQVSQTSTLAGPFSFVARRKAFVLSTGSPTGQNSDEIIKYLS
jgi:mannose-6-phosphate isomerase-like protein (cupin superfamily)